MMPDAIPFIGRTCVGRNLKELDRDTYTKSLDAEAISGGVL